MNLSRVEEMKSDMVFADKLAKGDPKDFPSQSVTQGLVRSNGWFLSIISASKPLLSSPTVSLLVWREVNSASLLFRLCLCKESITLKLPMRVWMVMSFKAEFWREMACFTCFTLTSLYLSLRRKQECTVPKCHLSSISDLRTQKK